jgi:hypothetical protein
VRWASAVNNVCVPTDSVGFICTGTTQAKSLALPVYEIWMCAVTWVSVSENAICSPD